VQYIPHIHMLNFNHKYPIASHSYVTTFLCRHRHAALLPPRSNDATTTAAVLPLQPQCCHADAVTLPPPLSYCHHRAANSAAVLPPSSRHRYCHHIAINAAGIAKLPLLPPSCGRCHYLHCKIGLIMKKNSVG
jgi:hypothetical protein